MSATPAPYNRQANFVTEAQGNANITVSQIATELDAEFNAINTAVDQTQSRLAEIQRDDGALKNGVVTSSALSTDILNKITTADNSYRGVWAVGTTYYVGDVVYKDLSLYYCAIQHTAANFTTELGDGDWTLVGATTSDTNDPNAYVPLTRWSLNPNGTATVFTITGTTVTNSAAYLVTVDGVLQDPASYTITTNTITFSEAPPSGTAVVVVGIGYAKGVLAGAIGTVNLADSAVTTAKIANGAVTSAKLSTGGPSWATDGQLGIGRSISLSGTSGDYSNVSITNSGGVQVHLNANGNSEGNLRTVTNHRLSFSTNNTERMVLDTSGNVGIGTSSPSQKLNVIGGVAFQQAPATYGLNASFYSGGGDVGMVVGTSPSGYVYQSVLTNHALVIGTNNAERVRIAADGTITTNGNPITNCPTTAKAWVNWNGATSGTWAGGASTVTRTAGSTTATVTTTNAHGLTTGNTVYALTGVVAGLYTVTVLSSTTFTITTVATTSLAAVAITFQVSPIRSSYNVSSVAKVSAGAYRINFLSPITSGYSVSGVASNDATNTSFLELNELAAGGGAPTTTSVGVRTVALSGTTWVAQDSAQIGVSIFGN